MKKLDLTQKIFKNFIASETKVASGAPRTLVVKITSSSPDRSQDIVEPKGMNADNFMKNPVVLFAHNYGELPVAKCTSLKVLEDGVLATVEFMPEGKYIKSDIVYDMYKGGFLNAWSVGFMPSGEEAYEENQIGGYTFKKWELLEFSSVPVPANAEALTVMRSKGIKVDELMKSMPLKKEVEKKETKDPGYKDETKVADLTVKQLKELIVVEERIEITGVEKDVAEVGSLAYVIRELSWLVDAFEDNKVSESTTKKMQDALVLLMEAVKEQAEIGKKSFSVNKAGRTISAKHESLLTECVDMHDKCVKNLKTILDTVAEEEGGKSAVPAESALSSLMKNKLKRDLISADQSVGLALRTLKLFESGKGGEK